MEGAIILVILVILAILCGPIALIITIVTKSKTSDLEQKIDTLTARLGRWSSKTPVIPEVFKPVEKIADRPPIEASIVKEFEKTKEPVKPVSEKRILEPVTAGQELPTVDIYGPVEEEKNVAEEREELIETKGESLEQRIGTKWVLIAGVITVIVAVGFFLKYAYDNALIGPLGRVVIAVIGGLIALAAGEVTRRRGYGIVAKGVTALGFAILYAAVFSAYRLYHLVDSVPTFVLAILITAAAMLYAVSLNEILMAFLSLLGGFLTPILVSTGENKPVELFSYLLVLGVGSMMCAYYRKWRAISLLSFIGTFFYYIGWFEKFFRHTLSPYSDVVPAQMGIVLTWLGIFFLVYLIQPILYNLVKRVKAYQEDSFLLLINSAITFYYLWTVLFAKYRVELAMCSLGLCALHLGMMSVVMRRCREDLNLRLVLLLTGIFFLTMAVPLYLKMYAVSIAWGIEGVIVAVIGLRYRSIVTQVLGGVAFLLSLGWLLYQLPMHSAAFTLIFNPSFGSWLAVIGAGFVCHVVYRRSKQFDENIRSAIAQITYAASTFVLLAAMSMEWYWNCRYNMSFMDGKDRYVAEGLVVIISAVLMLFIVPRICPTGMIGKILGAVMAVGGAVFTIIAFSEFHRGKFIIFANAEFGIALLFVASLFLASWLLKRESATKEYLKEFSYGFAIGALFVLWVLLTEEIYCYWYWRNRTENFPNWLFLAHMYISVMWAIYAAILMVLGFVCRSKVLRYIALAMFALLLAKVFILDMAEVKSVYRIAAFFATGITLVGVSYLYQYLKKKGFFEVMSVQR